MKEFQHTGWKESWRDDYLRWVCGFSNAEGGVLVIDPVTQPVIPPLTPPVAALIRLLGASGELGNAEGKA